MFEGLCVVWKAGHYFRFADSFFQTNVSCHYSLLERHWEESLQSVHKVTSFGIWPESFIRKSTSPAALNNWNKLPKGLYWQPRETRKVSSCHHNLKKGLIHLNRSLFFTNVWYESLHQIVLICSMTCFTYCLLLSQMMLSHWILFVLPFCPFSSARVAFRVTHAHHDLHGDGPSHDVQSPAPIS